MRRVGQLFELHVVSIVCEDCSDALNLKKGFEIPQEQVHGSATKLVQSSTAFLHFWLLCE